MNVNNELVINLLDNVLDGNLIFALGLTSGYIGDKLFPKFNKNVYDKKNVGELYLEIALYVSYIIISSILIKYIATNYKSPIEFLSNDTTHKIVSGTVVLAFSLMFFQSNLKDKIKYLQKRLIH